MKDIDFDKVWIGLLLGIAVPFIAFVSYYLINYHYMPISAFINYLRLGNVYTQIISLCVLANLTVFYPYIWKQKYNGARGVLSATFIWASVVLFLKFFT